MSQPIFSMQNFSCMRAGQLLFPPINLDIHPGQLWQIMGANGSGKTTLLRTLAGLMPVEVGQLVGSSVSLYYLGHALPLKSILTVEENIHFISALHNLDTEFLPQAYKALSLETLRHRYIGELSAGQSRKVALAALWCCRDRVWILDEPFIALDKQTQQILQQCFIRHINNGGTIIFSSHQDIDFLGVEPLTLKLESF